MSGGSGKSGLVAVLCGDPVVARIVGNLLHTVGYDARPAEDIPPEEVPGVSLLFIAPGADAEEVPREAFEAFEVPILDLSGSSWPHRIEDIKTTVDSALPDAVAELTPDIVVPDIVVPLEPEAEAQ